MEQYERGVSPYSTGGGGVTFERKVAVQYLTHLLLGDGAAEFGDGRTVVGVDFQQAPDFAADDLVIRAARAHEAEPSLILAIGVRRTPDIVASDGPTRKLVRAFTRLIANPPASDAEIGLGLVVSGAQAHARQLSELAALAAVQVTPSNFFTLVRTPDKFNRDVRGRLDQWEFYSLVERHQDGRPDMIGMEAVNQLLVALEVHRFDFCFIGAGYEKEVDEFLTVNPGLAGRFNRKLRFESYTPDELVEIAVRYGEPRATVIEPAAREALNVACTMLRAYLGPDGRHGIDVMQNGRFARNVVERAERLRDSRVAAQHRTDRGSVTVEDLETLRTQDIIDAVLDACAEKHVPIVL